jgi:hypothetical protein
MTQFPGTRFLSPFLSPSSFAHPPTPFSLSLASSSLLFKLTLPSRVFQRESPFFNFFSSPCNGAQVIDFFFSSFLSFFAGPLLLLDSFSNQKTMGNGAFDVCVKVQRILW